MLDALRAVEPSRVEPNRAEANSEKPAGVGGDVFYVSEHAVQVILKNCRYYSFMISPAWVFMWRFNGSTTSKEFCAKLTSFLTQIQISPSNSPAFYMVPQQVACQESACFNHNMQEKTFHRCSANLPET